MKIYIGAVLGVIVGAMILPAQTHVGRNHRAVGVSRHGTAAIEFDLEGDWSLENAGDVSFRLPDQFPPVRLDRQRFEKRLNGGGFWRGTVVGRTDSEVMITSHAGVLAGTIRMGADLYEIRPSPGGQVIERIDPSSFSACAGSLDLSSSADASNSSEARASIGTDNREAGELQTIDLLSVYTPQARAAAGGAAQIHAIIQAAVDAANQAFSNSQIGAVYRLVKTAEATRDDSGDLNQDLAWVAGDAATANLRNEVGADMVSLVVEDGGGFCGMSYAMRSPGSGFAAGAFQVTRRGCAVSNLSFAHEHGHNLGMEHDPAYGAGPANASYPWSFGQIVNGVFRTVMSYPGGCPNGCERVAYFSNPNVTYLGYPTGVSGTNDNARTGNLTASIVAAFRSAPIVAQPSPPPASPSGLAVTMVSPYQISLAWIDQAADEAGFRIERAQNGGTFAAVATPGPNTFSYLNAGLTPSTQYSYRVRAYNASGESGYSNTVIVTTLSPTPPVAPAGLRASGTGPGQITLSWFNASYDAEGFRVEKSSGNGVFDEIATLGAGATSHSVSGLVAGPEYSFRVRAYNRNVYSASNIVSAKIASVPIAPDPPVGFSGTAVFLGAGPNRYLSAVRLSWSGGGETAFRIEKCRAAILAEACAFSPFRTVTSNLGLTLDGTISNVKGIYKYRVRGENKSGNSTWVEATVDTR